MKRLLLVAAGLVLCLSLAFGQEKEAFEHDPQERKHHIGINIPFPRLNYEAYHYFLPVGLMYRRQIEGKNAAYRLGFSSFQNIGNQKGNLMQAESGSVDINTRISLGKEWQQQIFQRLHLLNGMDAYFEFKQNRFGFEREVPGNDDYLIYRSNQRTNSFGLSPFVGLRYMIHKQIYVSYVFQGDAFFRNASMQTYRLRQFENGSSQEFSDRNVNKGFGLDFTPSHGVYLNFLF